MATNPISSILLLLALADRQIPIEIPSSCKVFIEAAIKCHGKDAVCVGSLMYMDCASEAKGQIYQCPKNSSCVSDGICVPVETSTNSINLNGILNATSPVTEEPTVKNGLLASETKSQRRDENRSEAKGQIYQCPKNSSCVSDGICVPVETSTNSINLKGILNATSPATEEPTVKNGFLASETKSQRRDENRNKSDASENRNVTILYFVLIKNVLTKLESNNCEEGESLPDVTNCRKYYRCLKISGKTSFVKFGCQHSTTFHFGKGRCVQRNKTKCLFKRN